MFVKQHEIHKVRLKLRFLYIHFTNSFLPLIAPSGKSIIILMTKSKEIKQCNFKWQQFMEAP